jgi:hypothetical protein
MRQKLYLLFLFALISLCGAAQAHTNSSKIQAGIFDRIIWLGTDARQHLFLYMDGPRVLFRLNRNWKLGPAFFPTLMYNYRKGDWNTGLGAGVRVDYKRFSLGLPMYKIEGEWRPAIGFGFKF